MVDKNKFFSELDALGRDKVKVKVEQHSFRKKELRLIQEWFRCQPFRDFQTFAFHPLQPKKQVAFFDAIDLYQKGWTDGSTKYPPGLRGLWYRSIIFYRHVKEPTKQFFIRNRDGLLVRIIGGIFLLFFAYLINTYILNRSHKDTQKVQSQQTTTRMTANPK